MKTAFNIELIYDPISGEFSRNYLRKKKIGTIHHSGYLVIRHKGKIYQAHRLAWEMSHGKIPNGKVIDHINHNKLDNRLCNLRLADKSQNNQNRLRGTKRNKTGFLGVSPHKNKFRPTIQIRGKKIMNLGLFDTPEEAHAAYLKAKRELHEFNTL